MLAKKGLEHCSGCKFDWDHNPLVYRLIELALILPVAMPQWKGHSQL